VRRHSKAATATRSQAIGLGNLFGGAAGTPGESSPAQGNGASAAAFAVCLFAAFVALGLGAASAFAAAPTISSTSVSAVTTTTALLEAGINPQGEATTYHFEYGAADCASSPCTSIPVPNGNVGSGSEAVTVKHEAEGLTPGATYHYRVVASNGSGTTEGADQVFSTYSPPSVSTDCPNQANRTGFSAALPDCRAYEMVSPVDKNGGDIKTLCNINCYRTALNQASLSGDKVTYSSYKAFGDSLSSLYSNQYIATRGTTGWMTHAINPLHARTPFSPEFSPFWDLDVQFKTASPDLSKMLITDDSEPAAAPGGVNGEINLVQRDTNNDTYEEVTSGEPLSSTSVLAGTYSQDGTHAVFQAHKSLAPEAPAGSIYDFTNGEARWVGVLPNGEAAASARLGAGISDNGRTGGGELERAVSADGSRIIWTATENSGFFGEGPIYERVDGHTTVQVAGARSHFVTASTDGTKVFFSSGGSLMVRNVVAETTSFVAPEFLGPVGTSDDGAYVYFVSEAALAPRATTGEPNLYVDHEGIKTYIATLSMDDLGGRGVGSPNILNNTAILRGSRVSADGHTVAFESIESLTGYDNSDAVNGEPDLEVFVYDAPSDRLECVSCRPSGGRPEGQPYQKSDRTADEPFKAGGEYFWTAAWLTTAERQSYFPRALSDDGSRLFFNSFDALLPQDTNDQQDVYEWEQQGTGTCDEAGGCLSLISSGKSPEISEFVDASPSGRDVFFTTSSSLDPQDPGLIDIYDAREGGGFPPPSAPPNPCFGDACQNVPATPGIVTPASASFHGAANPGSRPARDCKQPKRAGKLNHEARRLRLRARHAGSSGRARALRKRSARLAKQAADLSKRASRCRRANRRAQR
jgi:hypothetical protein